jgi:hypothetical protein
MGCRRFIAVVFLLLTWSSVRAHAGATLLLEEPYSVDGTFAGTGHVAVYLNRVCADTPFVLRRCGPGEQGVVLSRYHGIAGYDWFAIPLIPYLYSVDLPEQVPLYADPKVVAFLRNQYRRKYLAGTIPDAANGEVPEGPWVQLVGAAYDRTVYGFDIETSPEKDDELIRLLNSRPNKGMYRLLSENCADFVRGIINFYYPGALHRSVLADLGVTTPKQIAKCLVRFSKHHPHLQSTHFVIPQVPGTIKRSKSVRGVVESAFKAKKYMAPLLVWHPVIVGCFAAAYFTGSSGFDPGRHALVFDPRRDLEPPMSAQQRRESQSRLELLARRLTEGTGLEEAEWPRLEASAEPQLDAAGRPLLRLRVGDNPVEVGLARENIVTESESTEIAQHLLLVRLREELRKSASKVSQSDVHSDLRLLEELHRGRPELSSPVADTFEQESASELR